MEEMRALERPGPEGGCEDLREETGACGRRPGLEGRGEGLREEARA